ncbi:MAG: aldehyde dehydrogenase family protein [Deltaproteobacteria bacterium]|nr:aldehyde dehydrogenase family protein [Deltaproteobacteria bacterium]
MLIPDIASVDTKPYDMRYLIDGEVRTWSGAHIDVLSPIEDEHGKRTVLGRAPKLSKEEALSALAAAKRAWSNGRGEWPTMRVQDRIRCVERFTKGMLAVREDIVRLLMLEIGKSRKDSESEVDRTMVYIKDTIEALKELDRASGRFVMQDGFIGQTRRSPLGVALCMGPFNYPLNETFTTLIPALIMGNAIVSKLPKYGTLLHAPMFQAMAESFPKGVINIVQGDGATVVGPMMESGDVDVLAFIGSSRVANILKKQHPRPNRLRCILGLEAKNPAFVLEDADLDVAIPECVSGALSFNGQRCTGLKLIFVHETRAREFAERFAAAVSKLKAGAPWEPGVQITPLPEEGKSPWLQGYIDDAVQKGAKLIAGGKAQGTLFIPGVLTGVTSAMRIFHEEQFGPLVPIASYTDERELDAFMQASPYGQQVAIFGKSPAAIARLVDALANQVSRINLNTQCRRGPDTFPFTGRKDSAEATLSVHDALRAFSIRTVVATSASDANKAIVSDIVTTRRSAFLSTDYVF